MTLVRERAERLPAGLRIDALAVWFLFALVAVEIFLTCSYGFGNLANDFWLEQVVKRGWTSLGGSESDGARRDDRLGADRDCGGRRVGCVVSPRRP